MSRTVLSIFNLVSLSGACSMNSHTLRIMSVTAWRHKTQEESKQNDNIENTNEPKKKQKRNAMNPLKSHTHTHSLSLSLSLSLSRTHPCTHVQLRNATFLICPLRLMSMTMASSILSHAWCSKHMVTTCTRMRLVDFMSAACARHPKKKSMRTKDNADRYGENEWGRRKRGTHMHTGREGDSETHSHTHTHTGMSMKKNNRPHGSSFPMEEATRLPHPIFHPVRCNGEGRPSESMDTKVNHNR